MYISSKAENSYLILELRLLDTGINNNAYSPPWDYWQGLTEITAKANNLTTKVSTIITVKIL